ncbi:apyrase-like [Achroia grisella]|uniref:apyrase-like n=1 Tax=Achroia grisella TaxID=688607 RepID=UPI0027D2C7BE|nr:apyrase-like [Achroia grisella]
MNVYVCILLCIYVQFYTVSGAVLPDLYRLDIIHYNDFHDRFEETSIPYPVCKSNDTNCVGGFPRLYQEIQTLLKEKPGALLLNAGDTFQGTYWYTLFKWNVTQKFINLLPNDAHAIGNHEFDDGVAGLAPYLKALQAPVLAANIDTTNEPLLNDLYQSHVVLERKGRKIGIIGLITTETATSSNSQKVIFLDPIETVKKESQALTEKGIDIIIVLSHCGLEVDKKIASEVGENIDIIIGGHSHSLLWNGEPPSKEETSGPYPIIIIPKSSPGHKVLIATASAFTKYVGNITTYFDVSGDLQTYDGTPVFLNRSIPEDPTIKELMKPYKEKLDSIVHEVVGFVDDDLLAKTCGEQECALGDLIADAFKDATKQLNVSSLPHVVFLLRNMIRGSIGSGNITRGAIINTLPFTNEVVTFRLLGKYLVQALERCLKNYWVFKPFNGPWMPQVAGMQITFNTTEGRVLSAFVKQGEDFESIDAEKEYQVTTVNFLLNGGNGFVMLKDYGQNKLHVGQDAHLVENYIKKISPITLTVDNRITVIN